MRPGQWFGSVLRVSFSALTSGFNLTSGLTRTGKTMTLAVNFLQKCSRGRHLMHSMVPESSTSESGNRNFTDRTLLDTVGWVTGRASSNRCYSSPNVNFHNKCRKKTEEKPRFGWKMGVKTQVGRKYWMLNHTTVEQERHKQMIFQIFPVYLFLDDPMIWSLSLKVVTTFTPSTNDIPYVFQGDFLHSNTLTPIKLTHLTNYAYSSQQKHIHGQT